MKKFTHLLYAFVLALLVPQVGSASVAITVTGTKATVNSDAAGDVTGYEFSNADITGLGLATELVLTGSFNASDLSAIAAKTPKAAKVDMSGALFPTTTSGSSSGNIFILDPESSKPTVAGQTGKYAVAGGTLYQADVSIGYRAVETTETTGVSFAAVYADREAWEAAGVEHNSDPEYSYYKVTEYAMYFKKLADDGFGNKVWSSDIYNELTPDQKNNATKVTWSYDDIDAHLDDYNDGDIIKITKSDECYVKVENSINFEWKSVTYTEDAEYEVSYFFTNFDGMNNYTDASNGQYAIVGGTVYSWDGSDWVTVASTTMYDWSQMRFDYWKDTLEEAITSNYVDSDHGYSCSETGHYVTNGLSREIFKDCTKLEKVTFMSGNAIGFQDTQNGYALNEAVFGEKVTWITDGAFQRCKTLTKFSFVEPCTPTGLDLIIDAGAFAEATNAVVEGKFPNRLKTIGQRAFYEAKVGKFEVCENSGLSRLTALTNRAFSNSKISELVVPLSVTTINNGAFESSNNLSKITFQKEIKGLSVSSSTPVTVATGTFTGGNEGVAPNLDVYIEFSPSQRRIICEYDAFNYTQMQGQTSTSSSKFGRLHFAEEDWDYYQGDWKKGIAFLQSNLNAFKDGYHDDSNGYDGKSTGTIDTNTGKYEHATSGKQYTPANGWQQFAMTDTGIDILIPSGSFIRSYSSKTSYNIPQYSAINPNSDLRGKPMLRAFRVTAFSDGYQSGDDVNSRQKAEAAARTATATEVLNYLPKQTGLILVGETDASYLVYLEEANESAADFCEFPYNTVTYDSESSRTNLLFPSCDDTNTIEVTEGEQTVTKVIINPTQPYPIFSVNNNPTENFRIFGFMPANKMFGRPTPGVKIGNDMAYLKLPVNLFHWANEGSASSSDGLPSSGNSAKVFLDFSSFEEFGETTGITNVNENSSVENNVDGYFTLQGVKVDAPTQKGIYIYNGKKIMITK